MLTTAGHSPEAMRLASAREQEFKINALTVLRSLWPLDHNPFYAGFGALQPCFGRVHLR